MLETWIHDIVQAYRISRFWVSLNVAVRGKSKELVKKMQQGRLDLVCDLHPRRVWLHLRMMRLMTDRPQLELAASPDAWLLALVSEDNGGPEDVVVDGKISFPPPGSSLCM